MCDFRWSVLLLVAGCTLMVTFVHLLLRHHREGNKITHQIIERLRLYPLRLGQQAGRLSPKSLSKKLELDHDLQRLVSQEDTSLLKQALRQQFWLTVGVYLGAATFVATGIMAFRDLRPKPPGITDWELKSETVEAEGKAVDTDDLLLSWKAGGCSEEMEVWLQNMQNNKTTQIMKVNSGQQLLRLPRGSYNTLLASRELRESNRIRATAKTTGGVVVSPEWDLHVGMTVLLFTDKPDHIYISTLIDNSTANLPQFSIQGAIVTWEQIPDPAKGGGVAPILAEGYFKNPSAKVPIEQPLSAEQWRRLAFAYTGEHGWRVRQDKKLPLELTNEKLYK